MSASSLTPSLTHTLPYCNVVWVAPESRLRLLLPLCHSLTRIGFPTRPATPATTPSLTHSDTSSDNDADVPTHTIVAFYSHEDYMYAKDVWSWETQEVKPPPRVACAQDILTHSLSHSHTVSYCCIHDPNNTNEIDIHDDMFIALGKVEVVSDEDALVAYIQSRYRPQGLIDRVSERGSEVVPLAKRVVIVRHAQRLDEVHSSWSRLATRPQDSPLSELGVQQARCLGKWVGKQVWGASDAVASVYVSPFVRTVQTAHYMLEEMSELHPRVGEMLMSIEYGLAEGAPWMAHAANSEGLCQTPWHLSAADLMSVSNKIDLSYETMKTPVFSHGPSYPGRPVEEDAWYDRCAQAVWRLACHPTSEGRTLILVTHGGCVDNFVHALSGRHLGAMPTHTCVTSLVLNEECNGYVIERTHREVECVSGSVALTEEELMLSQDHLAPALRTGTVV